MSIQVELDDAQYDLFRETEAKVAPGARTKRVKRKKPYVSPYAREKAVPVEVVCIECKLPSHKGLPPFIRVNRLIDDEIRSTLRHYTCPNDADGILAIIIQQKADARKRYDEWRKGTGKVVSYHNGERKVIVG